MILQVAFKKTLPDYKKNYSLQKEVQGFVDINTTNSRKWLISNVDRLTAVALHDGAKWLQIHFFFVARIEVGSNAIKCKSFKAGNYRNYFT